MLRWAVMFGMVGMSTWIACSIDERTVSVGRSRAPGSAVLDDGGMKIFLDGSGGSGSGIFLDAHVFMDAGSGVFVDAHVFMDAGSGSGMSIDALVPDAWVVDAGTGSGTIDAGTGSGTIDAGTGSGSGKIDAGAGMDAHRGNTDNLDKTNFYTCASCTTNDAGVGALLVLAVATVLRRRRVR